jgi:hypothetical protein
LQSFFSEHLCSHKDASIQTIASYRDTFRLLLSYEFLNHKKFSAAAEGDSDALLRSGSGVAGVADARIQAAYQTLADAKLPITPAKLATRALTGYPTALRWLKIHHPEVLKPDATVAAEQAKPTHSETVQKQQPEAAPRMRGSAKANARKPPKLLRNPKNHPELPVPQPEGSKTTHAKTAQKQPDTTPGDIMTAPRRKNPPNTSVTPRTSLFRGRSYDQ